MNIQLVWFHFQKYLLKIEFDVKSFVLVNSNFMDHDKAAYPYSCFFTNVFFKEKFTFASKKKNKTKILPIFSKPAKKSSFTKPRWYTVQWTLKCKIDTN